MKKIILILLLSTLVNAQGLLFSKPNSQELNANINLGFNYTDILSAWNLTSGWSITGGVTITDLNTVTISSAGNLKNTTQLVPVGSVCRARIIGNTTMSPVTITVSDGSGGAVSLGSISSSPFDKTYIYVVSNSPTSKGILNFTLSYAGVVNFTNLELITLVPPIGFISTFTATDYVSNFDGLGCKFIEVTGTTYIEMEDTLDAGYYYVTATQNYTSGELNAYNGTSEVAFPQASGTSKKLVQLDGVHPLRLQVDNNSNITVTKLSIKRK